MKPKFILCPLLVAGFCASAAMPVVSNVITVRNSPRNMTVNYTLSGQPAIITFTAQTNRGDNVWVDLDDGCLTALSGDVNRIVSVGDHSLVWSPLQSWPNHSISGGNIRLGVKAWPTNAPPNYMVVSLIASNSVSFYTSEAALPFGPVTNDIYKTDYLVMRKIPAGNVVWQMGNNVGEMNGTVAPHEVRLAEDYYMGVYEVTQRQWYRIAILQPQQTSWPSGCTGDLRPVEYLVWETVRGEVANYRWPDRGHQVDPSRFFGKLRNFSGQDGFDYPTEAQWEFACRAGSGEALYSDLPLDSLANYAGNGGNDRKTTVVGSFEPNGWGLYDMYGNVAEYCLDWYRKSPLGYDPETGPSESTESPVLIVMRGGSWKKAAAEVSSYARGNDTTSWADGSCGFRVCCPAVVHE